MNNALYNQIRIFQSIAREGNISAAARKLEITPPSVSNALKLLEDHIGHPLFVRTTRRIELTETGQLLLEQTAARRWSRWNIRLKAFATRIRSPLVSCESRSRVLPIC